MSLYFLININITKELVYNNKDMGFKFKYPNDFTMDEIPAKGDPKQSIILALYSDRSKIIIVPSVQSPEFVESEKKFYNDILFKVDGQINNSKIEVNRFRGFKSMSGTEQLMITLYTEIDSKRSFVLRTEITASSTEDLIRSESNLNSIINSISFSN